MPKYKIWDKKEDIYTYAPSYKTGKMHWTAEDYIKEEAPWAGRPNAKVMISGVGANGGFFLDFDERVAFYTKQGLIFTDNMTDREILDMMEDYDNNMI